MNNQNLRVNEKSASEDEIDILEFFVTITENIKLLLVGPLACGLLVLGISFLVPQTYESSFTLGTNNMNADTGQIQRLVLGIKSVEDVAEKINVGNGSPLTVKDIRKKTTSVINPINTEIKFKVEAPNAQEAYFLATALLDTAFKYKAELLSNEAALLNKHNQSLATIIKTQNRLEKELEKSASDELLIRSYLAVIAQSTVLNELAVKQRLVVEGLNQIHAFEMPILQPKAVKPNKPTLFGLGVLISGFLFVLYIFIRKAFIINKSSKADLKLRKFKEI